MTAGPDDPGSSGPSDPGKSSTSGSAAGWYYYLDLHGAQQGPIHVAQLAPMVGSASPQSALFWQSGWPEWKVGGGLEMETMLPRSTRAVL